MMARSDRSFLLTQRQWDIYEHLADDERANVVRAAKRTGLLIVLALIPLVVVLYAISKQTGWQTWIRWTAIIAVLVVDEVITIRYLAMPLVRRCIDIIENSRYARENREGSDE